MNFHISDASLTVSLIGLIRTATPRRCCASAEDPAGDLWMLSVHQLPPEQHITNHQELHKTISSFPHWFV